MRKMFLMNRMTAISQKYENGTSDRIIRPQREGYEAERMQVILCFDVLFCTEIRAY